MGIFRVSIERHHRFQRFRRNTWKAIALCAAALSAGGCAVLPADSGVYDPGPGVYGPPVVGTTGVPVKANAEVKALELKL